MNNNLYTRPIVLIGIMIFCLFGCSQHQHTYSEADCVHPVMCTECGGTNGKALGHTVSVGVCERCGEVQGEDIIATLNDKFTVIVRSGSALIDCIEGVQDMATDAQYASFVEADGYTAEMLAAYEDVLEVCGDAPELRRISYQMRLLENSCPEPVKGTDASALDNQGVLYQLYLQQLSSSFNFLSEDMAYLAGRGSTPNPISYFDEMEEMPTPDSTIYGISFDSKKINSGTIQYTYTLGSNEAGANIDYNLYLKAIGIDSSLNVIIMDSYVTVEKDGIMVSVMMAGKDVSKGYFLTISFQQ